MKERVGLCVDALAGHCLLPLGFSHARDWLSLYGQQMTNCRKQRPSQHLINVPLPLGTFWRRLEGRSGKRPVFYGGSNHTLLIDTPDHVLSSAPVPAVWSRCSWGLTRGLAFLPLIGYRLSEVRHRTVGNSL